MNAEGTLLMSGTTPALLMVPVEAHTSLLIAVLPLLAIVLSFLSVMRQPDVDRLRPTVARCPLFVLPHFPITTLRETSTCSFLGETALLEDATTPPERPWNLLLVEVEGLRIEALVDTGASVSVISAQLCSRLRKVRTPYSGPSLCGANGDAIRPSGYCTVRVTIDGLLHYVQCAVLTLFS